MPTHVYNEDGKLIKVAAFDASLMLTLKDIFPNDKEFAKEVLEVKSNSPKGKLQKLYNVKDNSSLVRKIFRLYIKSVLWDIISGNCSYMFPGNCKAEIYTAEMKDSVVKYRRQKGQLHEFDLLATNYKIPRVKYRFSKHSRRQQLEVYVNKPYYKHLVDTANSGKNFSKRPKNINHFLPEIYEQFPYIKESSINKIVRIGSRRMAYNLRRGEELRIIDKDGEIRFYRPLGKNHDKVMRSVKKKRLNREKKQNESRTVS